LRSKNFVEDVISILQETGLEPSDLELELTETALMQESPSCLGALRALRDTGIRLTLDDFGTGYSSLSYLKRFPIDALKIDKSFIQGLCTSEDDANIVSAVIHMGMSFRLRVIAEGVETRDQLLRLQALQCAEGQGHYFQVPIPGQDFAKLLTSDLAATIVA
jgi:diguanylate cyclase